MAAVTPLSNEEVERVLLLLGPLTADRSVVLVGGQAVAYWGVLGVSDRMPALAPLTSKDIDFAGSARAARHAASLLGGSVWIAGIDDPTPNIGVVLFSDSDGVEREIDFIDAPLGLRAPDVRDTAVRLLISEESDGDEVPVWILHPERCMESRVYNVQILGKDDQNAMHQLEASIACAREWSRSLLADQAVQRASGSGPSCASTSGSFAGAPATSTSARSTATTASTRSTPSWQRTIVSPRRSSGPAIRRCASN